MQIRGLKTSRMRFRFSKNFVFLVTENIFREIYAGKNVDHWNGF